MDDPLAHETSAKRGPPEWGDGLSIVRREVFPTRPTCRHGSANRRRSAATTARGPSPCSTSFELFRRAAGVNALHVPYKGATAMMPDLMSGQVPIGVISALAAQGPTRSGKIRTLAVTSLQRLPSSPEWPTG